MTTKTNEYIKNYKDAITDLIADINDLEMLQFIYSLILNISAKGGE